MSRLCCSVSAFRSSCWYILFVSWVLGAIFFFWECHDILGNPLAPFVFTLFFLSAGQLEGMLENSVAACFERVNQKFCFCRLLNDTIFVLLLPIFAVLGPLYTLSFQLVNDDEFDWAFADCI